MPGALIKVGCALALGGLFSFFFSHSILLAAIISGIGYLLLVIGIIGWSVESSGDVSFS